MKLRNLSEKDIIELPKCYYYDQNIEDKYIIFKDKNKKICNGYYKFKKDGNLKFLISYLKNGLVHGEDCLYEKYKFKDIHFYINGKNVSEKEWKEYSRSEKMKKILE